MVAQPVMKEFKKGRKLHTVDILLSTQKDVVGKYKAIYQCKNPPINYSVKVHVSYYKI